MCGRYIFNDGQNEYIQNLVENAKDKFSQDILYRKDVFPSNEALVVFGEKPSFTTMHWGLDLNKKLVINARSETAFTSPFFENCKPCILPASSYYEFSKYKEPYLFYIEGKPIFLAGLCKDNHFVIMTEDATMSQKEIHPRQPVLFDYENAKTWCMNQNTTSLLKLSIQNRSQIKV